MSTSKIGVYICHCGSNISGIINIDQLKEFTSKISDVVIVKDHKFMCSDKGQKLIKNDIESGLINRVVVAACSPRMHEFTFRIVCEDGGLNPFLFEQANIREHASWVNLHDPIGAFEVAKDHINMAIAKAKELKPLKKLKVNVEPSCLIIGGGIAGMNAALDLANEGYQVYLVEKNPTIGGHMAQLDKTFPTMDCSACILSPRMVDIARNKNITLLTYSEVVDVKGIVGNFNIKIMKKPHYVDQIKCTGCGSCLDPCPVVCRNEFDLGMTSRKAIYIPFPQAVPEQYTIDMDKCIKCGICADPKVCEPEAIKFEDKSEFLEIKVGTIIVATGWDLYDPTELKQYGYGRFPNVISSLQMERLLSSFGPLLGNPARPSDLKLPQNVAFLQCVGSRYYREGGNQYCSRVCCMYATKQARQYKEKHPNTEVYIFYIDIRAFGKGYEEFYESTQREYGIRYIRGRIAEVLEDKEKNIIIRSEDTLSQQLIELKVNMLVLSCGLEPNIDSAKIGSLLSLQKSSDGFFMEAHPKLRPIDTLTEGVFIAGVAQGPKDIPDTVAQAKGAASGASSLMRKGEIEIEPYYAIITEHLCSGCKICQSLCPYGAIDFNEYKKIAKINPILCKGCGTCIPACPSDAIEQNHFTSYQLNSIINILKNK
ncbi:MAG: CoB--CoM heterodisulfide reductase iron-sulfur subunit A family protein [Candidatus Lokiarchaeota archaeon]|nr:CoB--CoM heterodisulfide reductase iron-sulfur subunit A family protein [Candidatus Lokiarchaeota archaeon]